MSLVFLALCAMMKHDYNFWCTSSFNYFSWVEIFSRLRHFGMSRSCLFAAIKMMTKSLFSFFCWRFVNYSTWMFIPGRRGKGATTLADCLRQKNEKVLKSWKQRRALMCATLTSDKWNDLWHQRRMNDVCSQLSLFFYPSAENASIPEDLGRSELTC